MLLEQWMQILPDDARKNGVVAGVIECCDKNLKQILDLVRSRRIRT